ncbi:class I SAM-dependent methyltransferase [Halovulum sp. GXIMD14794]
MNEAFFTLHDELPREGPGDRASLDRALALAAPPRDARILDAGCGPGADIDGLLAHAPQGHVTAIEAHPPFADRVAARFAGDPRVTARSGDMLAAPGPFDLIWSAGAVYMVGVTEALRAWRGALAPGGRVVFSEIVWLTDMPPREAAIFWRAYPAMTALPGLMDRIAAAGYRCLGHEILPDAAWEAYFTPIEARIAQLRPGADAAMTEVLDEQEQEIALWRSHRDAFGYALCVVEPA